jgi:hypothetical protein
MHARAGAGRVRPGPRRGPVSPLFEWIEQQAVRLQRIRPVANGETIICLRLARRRGPRIVLKDGTVVDPGDLLGELHLDNRRAAALHPGGHAGLRYRRELFRGFVALARELDTRPEYRAIRAVFGASLFWPSRLATEIGFEVRPLPRFVRWWQGGIEKFVVAYYHPEGRERLSHGQRTELRQVWISRRALLNFAERYGRGGDRRR